MRSLTSTLTKHPHASETLPRHGDLASVHVVALLRAHRYRKSTGLLTFSCSNSIQYTIYFHEGDIIAASTDAEDLKLGLFFYRLKQISLEQLETALAAASAEQQLGEVLVENRFISAEMRQEGLTAQFREILNAIFLLQDAKFSFVPQETIFAENLQLFLDTDNLIEEGEHLLEEVSRLSKDLDREDHIYEIVLPDAVPHRKEQEELLRYFDGERTTAEIFGISPFDRVTTIHILWHLLEQGIIKKAGTKSHKKREPARKPAQEQAGTEAQSPGETASTSKKEDSGSASTRSFKDSPRPDEEAGVFLSAQTVLDRVDLSHVKQYDIASDIPLDGIVETMDAEDDDEEHYEAPDVEDVSADLSEEQTPEDEQAATSEPLETSVDDELLETAADDELLETAADDELLETAADDELLETAGEESIDAAGGEPVELDHEESLFASLSRKRLSDEREGYGTEPAAGSARAENRRVPVGSRADSVDVKTDLAPGTGAESRGTTAAENAPAALTRGYPPLEYPEHVDTHEITIEEDIDGDEWESLTSEHIELMDLPNQAIDEDLEELNPADLDVMALNEEDLPLDPDQPLFSAPPVLSDLTPHGQEGPLDDADIEGPTVIDEVPLLSTPSVLRGRARQEEAALEEEISPEEMAVLERIEGIFQPRALIGGSPQKLRAVIAPPVRGPGSNAGREIASRQVLEDRGETYNRIFEEIFSHFAVKLGPERTLQIFDSFFTPGNTGYPEIFADLTFRKDGGLDLQKMLANLESYATHRPAEVFDACLNEVFYFLLRDIHMILDRDEQDLMMKSIVPLRGQLFKDMSFAS